jgi:hypothetical protein
MTRVSVRIETFLLNGLMGVVQLDAPIRHSAPEIPLAFAYAGIKSFNALFIDLQSTLAGNSV